MPNDKFVEHARKLIGNVYFVTNSDLTEKLHVLSNPESKVRREGQTAAFCCNVAGTPQPDKYQW